MQQKASAPTRLALPYKPDKMDGLVSAAICLLVLVYYLLTMLKGLYWYDSAELALAANSFGVAHPPGQPGWVVLASLWQQWLPGDALWLLNAFSAICAALGVVLLYHLVGMLLSYKLGNRGKVLLVLTVLWFAWQPLMWRQATRIEVYPLAGLFALIHFYWLARMHLLASWQRLTKRQLTILGLLVGLTASVHPIVGLIAALLQLLVLLPLFFRSKDDSRYYLSMVPRVLLAIVLPLSIYLYLFMVTVDANKIAWGDFSSFKGLWNFITAKDYVSNLQATTGDRLLHLFRWIVYTSKQGLWMLYVGVTVIFFWPTKKLWYYRAILAIYVGAMFVYIASNKPFYPENPDLFGTLIPTYYLMMVATCISAVMVYKRLIEKHWRIVYVCILTLMLALSVFQFNGRRQLYVNRSMNQAPKEWVHSVLSGVSEMARQDDELLIFVSNTDHFFYPSLYLQLRERAFPNVVVFLYGAASSSWYWNFLKQRYPQLHFPKNNFTNRQERTAAFLQANAHRQVFFEWRGLGASFTPGKFLCAQSAYVAARSSCSLNKGHYKKVIEQFEDWAMNRHLWRDPDNARVLYHIALYRALDLWRQGFKVYAIEMLYRALPQDVRRGLPVLERQEILNSLAKGGSVKGSVLPDPESTFVGSLSLNLSTLGVMLAKLDLPVAIHYLSAADQL